ncbi:MAG TPA: MFS transporter [Pirellulales bacterium]|nr:MFS transporter [Pirellulales bacterium]
MDERGERDGAPSGVRYQVMFLAAASSFVLYLDRYCLGDLLKFESVKKELRLDDDLVSYSFSAFFLSYALLQVPSGWLADRFGPRWLMTIYIVGWSMCAAATGLVGGFLSLFLVRVGLGVFQAGAYPTSGNIASRWMPLADRGTASAVIGLGGRLGAAAAMISTTELVQWSWRATMLAYGVIGCVIGVAFCLVARDRPQQHPRVNAGELALIEYGRPKGAGREEVPPSSMYLMGRLLSSGTMWAMCLSQIGTNIGWVFLVTWLPTYLVRERGVSDALGAQMNALALFIGVFGMLLGGRLTDLASRRLGLRLGRALPLVLSRLVAAGACLAVPYLDSPWLAIGAFCLVSFATDVGVPGTWAYMQDVGGSYVAAVLGWGNMWGNLGAAVAPVLVRKLSGTGQPIDWNLALMLCAGAFVVSGIAACFIDASRPIVGTNDTCVV